MIVKCWDCEVETNKKTPPPQHPIPEGEEEKHKFFVCPDCLSLRKERGAIETRCDHMVFGFCTLSVYWLPKGKTPCRLRYHNPLFVPIVDCPYSTKSKDDIFEKWKDMQEFYKKLARTGLTVYEGERWT